MVSRSSRKRSALIEKRESDFEIVKYSEHGLGHLLNPIAPDSEDRDWFRLFWEWILSPELGLDCDEPRWLDLPAMSRITTSSPVMFRPFDGMNHGRSYSDQIKPFNFMLSAHIAQLGHPEEADPTRFHLIAPYETDSSKWLDLPWTDRYSGERFEATQRLGAYFDAGALNLSGLSMSGRSRTGWKRSMLD